MDDLKVKLDELLKQLTTLTESLQGQSNATPSTSNNNTKASQDLAAIAKKIGEIIAVGRMINSDKPGLRGAAAA